MIVKPDRKLGLVLGGGGARGLAHIGVLCVLEQEGIDIHMLAGTSMGGIIGALYLAGVTPEQMKAEAIQSAKFSKLRKLIDIQLLKTTYLLKGLRIRQLIADYIGEQRLFSDLRLPFAVVTVDMKTGRQVVLSEGNVADAVRATMSVPGIFAPVELGNYTLVDGGVLNNVPVDVVRQMGAQAVIAVDVLPDFSQNQPGEPPQVLPLSPRKVPLTYQYLWHVQMVMISALTTIQLKESHPEIVIRPELPVDIDLFIGFRRPIEVILAGERAAEAALPQIKALLAGTSVSGGVYYGD